MLYAMLGVYNEYKDVLDTDQDGASGPLACMKRGFARPILC